MRYLTGCRPESFVFVSFHDRVVAAAAAPPVRVDSRVAAVALLEARLGRRRLRHESWAAVRRFLLGAEDRVVVHWRRGPMPVAMIQKAAAGPNSQ